MAQITIKQVKKTVEEAIEKSVEKIVEKGFEKQAVLINSAFQAHTEHFDNKLDNLEGRLKTDIKKVEDGLIRVENKVDRALHKEYTNLEGRVTKIENHLNIKPSKKN